MPSAYEQALAKVASGTSPEVAAAGLVAQMTLDEKVHCLDGGVPFWIGIGDITSGGYHSRPFRGARVERLGIPGFHFSDGPRGVVVGEATAFPVSMARGATFDPELEVRVGDAIGKELRAIGADLYGGVCVNLLRHPAWGRAKETYGEDSHHLRGHLRDSAAGDCSGDFRLARGITRKNIFALVVVCYREKVY